MTISERESKKKVKRHIDSAMVACKHLIECRREDGDTNWRKIYDNDKPKKDEMAQKI